MKKDSFVRVRDELLRVTEMENDGDDSLTVKNKNPKYDVSGVTLFNMLGQNLQAWDVVNEVHNESLLVGR